MIVGWIIAQIANPLVQFLEKRLHIVRRHSSMAIMAGSIFLIVLACYGAARWMVRGIRRPDKTSAAVLSGNDGRVRADR